MTSRLLIGLGWAICIAGFSGFIKTCQPDQEETELGGDLTYALGDQGLVRLQLEDPSDALFLRVHLELPQTMEFRPRDTAVYGVQVTTTEPNGEAHSQELWFRSRVSFDEEGAPTLVGPKSERSVTDGRLTELRLGQHSAPGSSIEFKPLLSHEDSRLLLRIERRPESLQMRLPWLGGAILSSRTARFTALPWTSLTRLEIQKIWSENRLPVSATVLKGETVELVRQSPATLSPLASTAPTRLLPGQRTSLTLQGPCRLNVTAVPLVSQEKLPMEWGPEVERIEGPAPNQDVQISSTSVEVPAGSLWTVHWAAPDELSGLDLSFEAPNGKACVWGEHAGSSWDSEVAPETRRFTAWSLSPDQELEVPVASGSGRGLLVVEARPQILEDGSPSLSSPSGVNSNLIYHFETDDGRVLSSGRAEVALAEEPYDRRVEPYSGWMGQPTRIALQHPSAATQVRFESDAPLDLRFLVPLPVEEERSSVYALPGGWTAQNASWELAPYVSLTPLQSQSLLSEQRLVRFDATVRPRRVLQSRPEGVQQTRSLVPKGQRIRHGVLETVRRPGSWREWHRTALGRTTRLNIPETGSLTVDYRTTASEPGVFTLLCNGEEFSHALNAEAGSFRLNGMPSNWNTCQLTAPGGDYFVNTPGSGRRWARRGLYRLTDTLEIEVDVPQGGTTVFVRVYTETGVRAAPLTLTIDEGRPVLRSGSTQFPSAPRQQRTPQRSGRTAQLIDRDEGALQAHRGIGITLGDDLVGSKHKVTIALPTGAEPVFVRFDSSAAPPREATADRHWYVDGEAP